MKSLVLGASGMLGQAVMAEAARRGGLAVGVDRAELDITDRTAVRALVERQRPELIINCAALTAVDACEGQRDVAVEVNGRAVAHVAEAAALCDAEIVQLSTDFVFDGDRQEPYAEDAEPAPLSAVVVTSVEHETSKVTSIS